jgi:hypothetical protein
LNRSSEAHDGQILTDRRIPKPAKNRFAIGSMHLGSSTFELLTSVLTGYAPIASFANGTSSRSSHLAQNDAEADRRFTTRGGHVQARLM